MSELPYKCRVSSTNVIKFIPKEKKREKQFDLRCKDECQVLWRIVGVWL